MPGSCVVPTVSDYATMTRQFTGVREATRELGLPTIDLLDTFDSYEAADVRVAENDRHPNERGHAILFERLNSAIRADPALTALVLGNP